MTLHTLHALLDDGQRLDAEYRGALSSHLPMALIALQRLGAGDARLAAFAATYAQRLHTAPSPVPWPAGEPWAAHLGDPQAWPAYRGLFREWFAHEGAERLLWQVLPVLMRGAGAAAFHGLLRTAYAVTADHAGELTDGLAYWACRWFTCGAPAGAGRSDDPAALLARLVLAVPERGLIAERMALAAKQPAFARAADALRIDGIDAQHTLPRLAQLAAERYAIGGDFAVLHLVTSTHAMRVLLPWLDDDDHAAALAHYWRAYAAAWATASRRRLPPAPLRAWPEIVAIACASDDDHLIKLVDSCREHEAADGGALWRGAASRAVTAAP